MPKARSISDHLSSRSAAADPVIAAAHIRGSLAAASRSSDRRLPRSLGVNMDAVYYQHSWMLVSYGLPVSPRPGNSTTRISSGVGHGRYCCLIRNPSLIQIPARFGCFPGRRFGIGKDSQPSDRNSEDRLRPGLMRAMEIAPEKTMHPRCGNDRESGVLDAGTPLPINVRGLCTTDQSGQRPPGAETLTREWALRDPDMRP